MIAKTNDIKVLEILLKVYESKKNEEKQRFILEKILNTNPKNTMMKMKLARIYMNNCQFTEA
jgi:lipopolysaccharide biosynthesis regulator YciM